MYDISISVLKAWSQKQDMLDNIGPLKLDNSIAKFSFHTEQLSGLLGIELT